MQDHFSAKHTILVSSLPIKNMLDYFAFNVFLVVMAAHKKVSSCMMSTGKHHHQHTHMVWLSFFQVIVQALVFIKGFQHFQELYGTDFWPSYHHLTCFHSYPHLQI